MATAQGMSSIKIRMIHKGINKFYNHLGIVISNRGGIGGRVILAKFNRFSRNMLIEINNNKNNNNNNKDRKRRLLLLINSHME